MSNSSDDKEWKSIYDAVVSYGERTGNDCNVPLSYQCIVNKKYVKLGVWLAAQRLNKAKGLLSPEQDALLQVCEDLFFLFQVRLWKEYSALKQVLIDQNKLDLNTPRHCAGKVDMERWNANYEALIRYGQQYGHCNVPQATVYSLANGAPCKLGNWINKQRKDKKNESLLPDREKKLQILVDSGLLKWNMNADSAGSSSRQAAVSNLEVWSLNILSYESLFL